MRYLRSLKADTWLPYFMPVVWYVIFAVGVSIGAGAWIYLLKLRGLW